VSPGHQNIAREFAYNLKNVLLIDQDHSEKKNKLKKIILVFFGIFPSFFSFDYIQKMRGGSTCLASSPCRRQWVSTLYDADVSNETLLIHVTATVTQVTRYLVLSTGAHIRPSSVRGMTIIPTLLPTFSL
jgi:hypothetical protein